VGSRRVVDRGDHAEQLARALAEPARDLAVLVGLQVLKGIDEVGAVVTRPGTGVMLGLSLNRAVWPNRFRYALAAGPIDIGFPGKDLSLMDGAAFHRAAAALDRARAEGLPLALHDSVGDGPAGGAVRGLAESALALHGSVMSSWKPATARAALTWWAMRERRLVDGDAAHPTQANVAKRLGLDQSTISRQLASADAMRLADLERSVCETLDAVSPLGNSS